MADRSKCVLVGRRSDQLVGGGPYWGLSQVSDVTLLLEDLSRGLSAPKEAIAKAAEDGRPVLLQKAMWLSPDDLAWLSERANTTYVLTDTTRLGVVERGGACRSLIVTGTEALEAFRAAGCRARQMLQGFRPHVWRGPRPASVSDAVAFTGNLRAPRDQWVSALEGFGIQVQRRTAYAQEAAEFYRCSLAVLCPGPIGSEDSFSNRLVRTMAAGGLPLHWRVPSVERIFPHLRDLNTWGSAAELVELAGFWSTTKGRYYRQSLLDACAEAVESYRWDRVASRWLRFATGDDEVEHDGPGGSYP